MARQIWISREDCTGCSICVDICPDVFELDDESVAVVHNARGDTESTVQEAMDGCPEKSIHWHGRA